MKPIIEFVYDSHIYPYVRMTQKSKFVDAAARAYMASQQALKYEMKYQMALNKLEPYDHQPLGCDISFGLIQVHKADLDNLIKAVLDAGTGILYSSDAWIDTITARRKIANHPKMILQIWEL